MDSFEKLEICSKMLLINVCGGLYFIKFYFFLTTGDAFGAAKKCLIEVVVLEGKADKSSGNFKI